MPVSSSNDLLLATFRDVISALKNPHGAQPLGPLNDSRVAAIDQLHDIFRDHVNSVEDPPAPPADPAPAPPPQVALPPPMPPPPAPEPAPAPKPQVDDSTVEPALTQDLTFATVTGHLGKKRRARKRKSKKVSDAAKLVAAATGESPVAPTEIPRVETPQEPTNPTVPPSVQPVAASAALPRVTPTPVPRVATPPGIIAPQVLPKPRPVVPTPPWRKPRGRPKGARDTYPRSRCHGVRTAATTPKSKMRLPNTHPQGKKKAQQKARTAT